MDPGSLWLMFQTNVFNPLGVMPMPDSTQNLEAPIADPGNPYDTAPRDTHSVSGRKLSNDEIKLIQECRRAAVLIGELCTRIENTGGIDKRWSAIAKTDLQKGFMALVRSIAKPETF